MPPRLVLPRRGRSPPQAPQALAGVALRAHRAWRTMIGMTDPSPQAPALAETSRRRRRRGYLSIALITVLPAGAVLVGGQNTPLIEVGIVWLVGILAISFAPQFPAWQKAVAVLALPACAIAWRIVNLLRGETVCVSSSGHPATVCAGGRPAFGRVSDAMPVLIAVVLVTLAVLLVRAYRARADR
jgi:hypothetical protein